MNTSKNSGTSYKNFYSFGQEIITWMRIGALGMAPMNKLKRMQSLPFNSDKRTMRREDEKCQLVLISGHTHIVGEKKLHR